MGERPRRERVTVLGIDVKTGCFGGPEQREVLGQGKVTAYHAGRWQRAASGEVLTLGIAPAEL